MDDPEIIHSYSSKQATEDGFLVWVGKCKPSGINYFSRSVWESIIVPYDDEKLPDSSRLVSSLKYAVLREILRKGERIERFPRLVLLDWYYKVEVRNYYDEDWIFLLCRNETGGYTLMFPEDY